MNSESGTSDAEVKKIPSPVQRLQPLLLELSIYNDEKECFDVIKRTIKTTDTLETDECAYITEMIVGSLKNSKYVKRDQWSLFKKTWNLSASTPNFASSNSLNSPNNHQTSCSALSARTSNAVSACATQQQITLKLEKTVSYDDNQLQGTILSLLSNTNTSDSPETDKFADNTDCDDIDAKAQHTDACGPEQRTIRIKLFPSARKMKPPSSRKYLHLQQWDLVPINVSLDDALKTWFVGDVANDCSTGARATAARQFTKYHTRRLDQLKQCIREGFFTLGAKSQNHLNQFYDRYVLVYSNDLLYQLFQMFNIIFYDPNVEANIDNFYNSLLYYVGFCDVGANMYTVPQLKLSSSRSRGDVAVGLGPQSSDGGSVSIGDDSLVDIDAKNAKQKDAILSRLFMFMEDKSFEWSNDAKNENKFGDVTAQLVFGAIEALHYRQQYDEDVFLFRNLGGKVNIYKIKVTNDMYDIIFGARAECAECAECADAREKSMEEQKIEKAEKAEKGFWMKRNGESPVSRIDGEMDIFNSSEDFVKFIEILEKILMLVASPSHPKLESFENLLDKKGKEPHVSDLSHMFAEMSVSKK